MDFRFRRVKLLMDLKPESIRCSMTPKVLLRSGMRYPLGLEGCAMGELVPELGLAISRMGNAGVGLGPSRSTRYLSGGSSGRGNLSPDPILM